ncbi:MAG: RrF2 family transcriptional regulator [Clostridia bacterium]|nr:RrF2 family transcriptional regulator [Clostridia bacterium]
MTISTRGRYALRVVIDLAENGKDSYIPMKEVAERQDLPLKYLERILPVLTQNHIVEGQHGKGGGYRLTRKPEEYTVGEILRLAEGDLAPVACLECGAKPCEKADRCRTIAMWKNLQALIDGYFDGITIRDLMREESDNSGGMDVSFLDAAL